MPNDTTTPTTEATEVAQTQEPATPATTTERVKPAKATTVASKLAPKPAVAGKAARASRWPADAAISVLSATNPKKPGSKSHARFRLYASNPTVEAFLKAGGLEADLAWDTKHKFISVAAPVSAKGKRA